MPLRPPFMWHDHLCATSPGTSFFSILTPVSRDPHLLLRDQRLPKQALLDPTSSSAVPKKTRQFDRNVVTWHRFNPAFFLFALSSSFLVQYMRVMVKPNHDFHLAIALSLTEGFTVPQISPMVCLFSSFGLYTGIVSNLSRSQKFSWYSF